MVDYIGVATLGALVEEMGVATFIEALAAEIEADYRRWKAFEKSPRLASHSAVGVIELMPITDGELYSFKYVNGHPRNTAAGLLTVTAFGVLAEVGTGYPLLLSELTVTTALRTAAMSALAAKWMARPDSRIMALIGNGAQSEFQAIAFRHMLGIEELRLFDTDVSATAKLERNLRTMSDLTDMKIVRAGSTAEAVRGADIVTTVTADKRNATILTPPMIAGGMHLNAVGGDCPGKTELHPDILQRSDCRIVVEYEPQSRIEGEIQQLSREAPVIEFSQVVQGEKQGRGAAIEVTLFDSVGFALEDYSGCGSCTSSCVSIHSIGIGSIWSQTWIVRRIWLAVRSDATGVRAFERLPEIVSISSWRKGRSTRSDCCRSNERKRLERWTVFINPYCRLRCIHKLPRFRSTHARNLSQSYDRSRFRIPARLLDDHRGATT